MPSSLFHKQFPLKERRSSPVAYWQSLSLPQVVLHFKLIKGTGTSEAGLAAFTGPRKITGAVISGDGAGIGRLSSGTTGTEIGFFTGTRTGMGIALVSTGAVVGERVGTNFATVSSPDTDKIFGIKHTVIRRHVILKLMVDH